LSRLVVYLFGPPRIVLDGNPIVIDRNKATALFAYLAITPGKHSRQSLATLFWPESEQEKAYAYLRRTLWTLNEALGEGWLKADRETIDLDRGPGFWLDVDQFRILLAECSSHGHSAFQACPECISALGQAVDLYQADFMAGFSLKDSPAFDDWQFLQADHLRREQTGALEQLARCYAAQAQYDRAIEVSQRWLALDPLDEAAHRLLMVLYSEAGQRNAALRQFQECVRILKDELDIAPEDETRLLYERIRAEDGRMKVEKPKQVSAFIPGPSLLPPQPTPFIGRDEELDAIAGLLRDPGCRLLTLTGPGGTGKTRLAIQAASRAIAPLGEVGLPGTFQDGVYFVGLGPLSAAEFLIQTIAETLKFSFRAEEPPKQQLLNYLREKRLLLVMDNFEHLIAGVGLLSEILAAAPDLKLLVTSRERLNLRDEWVLEVHGMHFPASQTDQPLEEYSAVRLFLQSARMARVDFSLSEEDKSALIRICQLVEGLPLGIELAAAWVKIISCREIAQEIERNLDFLASSMRDIPERHQSLRAVFEHSWELLTVAEQNAFRKLSVFRGAFHREAAEALIGVDPGELHNPTESSPPSTPYASLSLLAALVDKSMLRRNISGLYEMHELLKQYAAEKLSLLPEEQEQASERHCAYYSAFLEKMGSELRGKKLLEALKSIEEVIEDLRVAWIWAVQHGSLTQIWQCGPSLSQFFEIRGRSQEGEDLFGQADEKLLRMRSQAQEQGTTAEEIDALRIFLLRQRFGFLVSLGSFDQGFQLARAGLALFQNLDNGLISDQHTPAWTSRAFLGLMVRFGVGELATSQVNRLYQESVEEFQKTGDNWAAALSHLIMGDFFQYNQPDMIRSRMLRQQSLAMFTEIGNQWGMEQCLNDLSTMAYGLGEYAESRRLALQSLAISKELGDRWRAIQSLLNLGQVATAMGEYDHARDYYLESLGMVRETGNRSNIAVHLDCVGYVEYLLGDYEKAELMYQQSLVLNRENSDGRGIGMALVNLGDVARGRGDLEKARTCLNGI
jgi:predicted ATPase/DNA-binding SARP family transcriptional activator